MISESLLGAGVTAVLLALMFYFKNKAEKSEVKAVLAETKGRDAELKAAEDLIAKQIEDVKNRNDSDLTPEERAKRWEN